MKKIILTLLAAVLLVLMVCGDSAVQAPEASPAQEITEPASDPEAESSGVLVVYYSSTGSTEAVAGYIADALNGDTFTITPAEAYTSDDLNWRDPNSRTSREHDDPSLRIMELTATTVENWDSYDTVFIGYPNWWGDMPMILYSFLEQYDFSGKTIVPFNTHGGSGFSSTISTIRTLEPQANVLNGLSISRDHIQNAEQEIIDWVQSLNI